MDLRIGWSGQVAILSVRASAANHFNAISSRLVIAPAAGHQAELIAMVRRVTCISFGGETYAKLGDSLVLSVTDSTQSSTLALMLTGGSGRTRIKRVRFIFPFDAFGSACRGRNGGGT